MCGIAALILANDDARSIKTSTELYEALGVLQHRGQDAAGITTCGARGKFFQSKGNGMVRDVFCSDQLSVLTGYMGLAHVRYPTAGTSSNSEAQPFYVNSPYGIAFAHNGNLTNAQELSDFLDFEAHRHVNTESDSELLLNIFANHLQKTGKVRVNEEDIFTALKGVYQQCKGGYACIGMIAGFGLFAFRDPNGIRPLIYGSRKSDTVEGGLDYMFASESVALDVLGYSNFTDVQPGEAILITKENLVKRQCTPMLEFSPCIFEYVYFSRPDSILDGVSVYRARLAMGEALAQNIIDIIGDKDGNLDIDVVIPVPDTSRVAALQVSTSLKTLYREGFIKNRYIGRTFIMPGQSSRKKNVRRKLNPMAMEFAGRNVLIVDDSIVRGTTSKEIVSMARECGAKKVYFASCAPPIRYPNVYGIDMPTKKELIAHSRSEKEIAEELGADYVFFQKLEDLTESITKFNPRLQKFENSVFNGCYVTKDIDDAYLETLELKRRESEKKPKDLADTDVIGLHNRISTKRK